jgi:hypothetical protein
MKNLGGYITGYFTFEYISGPHEGEEIEAKISPFSF